MGYLGYFFIGLLLSILAICLKTRFFPLPIPEKIKHIEVTTSHIILTFNSHTEKVKNNKAGKRYIDKLTNDKLKRRVINGYDLVACVCIFLIWPLVIAVTPLLIVLAECTGRDINIDW